VSPAFQCPVETFPALDEIIGIRAAFLQRCPGIDVQTDRETVVRRLWDSHRRAADAAGFEGMPFVMAEQIHGREVAVVNKMPAASIPATDGLITSRPGICLAVYVADCAPVYLADRHGRAVGLVHSGRKGTELNIVGGAISTMSQNLGIAPSDLVVQIGPCIRPPHYETDIAQDISRQARQAGVVDVHDCGRCTASDPDAYYSYRRDKGSTGRLLALMARL